MLAPAPSARKRAVVVIRVSRVGKREADKFISPEDQMKLANQLCAQHGWDVVQVFHELDQSGLRTKFEKRKGLFPATRMVEAGEADVVVMAFFDRMARNIVVQTEFLGRVGRAGGEVWAHDWGRIQTDSAVAMLAAGMMGLVTMYVAESTAEKTQGPKERAIERGIPTFPHIPAGYRQKADGSRQLEVFEPEAKLIREAFAMRARGDSYRVIRDWLRGQGLRRSTRGVQDLLKNRIYLGELHFGRSRRRGGSGEMVNLNSHAAVVERSVFDRVKAMRGAKGERGAVESVHAGLLSRQGILRCAACDRAMVVMATRSHGRTYVNYRCPPIGDCTERAAIMADNVDAYIAERMKLIQKQGSYSAQTHLVAALADLTAAQADMQQAMRNLATFRDTAQAQVVLEEFRMKVQTAQERVDQLRRAFGPSAIRSMADWETLSLTGRRDLLRALIKRITVCRGARGAAVDERLSVEFFLE